MQIVNKAVAMSQFDKEIYQTNPLYITCNEFWDGGIKADSSLKEKARFYSLAEKMSKIIQEIVLSLKEDVFIGSALCEGNRIYANWSDLESYELFREISRIIKRNKYYHLSFPEDDEIIDLIVEANFRYFTCISLYLPKTGTIIQPSCHSEVLVYSKKKSEVLNVLEAAVSKYSAKTQRICLTDADW